MEKFRVNDRVEHDYLGESTVKKLLRSAMDSTYIFAYIIYTDKKPDVRYNMGNHNCMAFPDELKQLEE